MIGERRLWTGVLLPPLAWAVHLSVSYFLAAFACDGAGAPIVHLVSVVSLTAIGSSGAIAWRALHADAAAADPPRDGRQRFMAAAGVGFAVLFALTVAAQWFPVFLIEPCRS